MITAKQVRHGCIAVAIAMNPQNGDILAMSSGGLTVDSKLPPIAAPLDLAFLAVGGRDAESFLNAQLSRRVPSGNVAASAPLAAWHDAQGRVRCTCRVLGAGDVFSYRTACNAVWKSAGEAPVACESVRSGAT